MFVTQGKSDELRAQAEVARRSADSCTSISKAVIERRRQKALTQLADNEDWLDGKTKAAD